MHRIIQSYYDENSKKYLDPAAEPVDVSFGLDHELCDYNIFKTLLENGTMDPDSGPVGLISWKFQTKTLVSVSEFSAFCQQSFARGADVAFINPMIGAEAMYKNVWEQAEHSGQIGMLGIVGALFSEPQIKSIELMPKSAFALYNYFVGNSKFWSQYMAFCDGVLNRIKALKEANPPMFALVHQGTGYQRNKILDFRPFILERLFSTFLMLHPEIVRTGFDYRSAAYKNKFNEKKIGQILYVLSGLKNNAIHSTHADLLNKWDEMRRPVLSEVTLAWIWLKDNPQPTQPVEKQLATANAMTVTLDKIESALSQMLEHGDLEALFSNVLRITYNILMTPELEGRTLFLPQLDVLMHRAALTLAKGATCRPAINDIIVHVATEIYEIGGHTRVIEDIARALPERRHILILTDAIKSYRLGHLTLELMNKRFDTIGLEVIFLQETTLTRKTVELSTHLARLAPQAILLQAHHFDPVANAGVSGHSAPRVLYLHHCDHNPALGATRTDFIHVDPSPACYDICKTHTPSLSPTLLGLSVEDRGIIEFSSRNHLVGATCGSPLKYAGRCEFSYAELLAALFANGVTKMFHIGDMPEVQREQIKAEIRTAGQNAEQVVFLPNTPSLSGLLKELSPAFFLISHPTAGGKSTIEAMSLGLPLLFPRPASSLPLLCWDMSLGNALVIEKLEDTQGAIDRLQGAEKELRRRNREVFEQYYSMPIYRKKLLELISG